MYRWFVVLLVLPSTLFAQPFNTNQMPAAKTSLAEMPADGSGVYRLSLDAALGAAPLNVFVDIRSGKATRAVALPTHNANAWCPVDASGLAYQNGKLTGSVRVECIPPFSLQSPFSKHYQGKPNPKYAGPYSLKPTVTGTVSIDAVCDGLRGSGTYEAKWTGAKEMPFGYTMKPNDRGSLSLIREPARPLPVRYECDLFLASGLGDSSLTSNPSGPSTAIWMRLAMDKGSAVKAFGFVVLKSPGPGNELSWKEVKTTLVDGKLQGRLTAVVKDHAGDSIQLDIQGQAISRRLFGTVASTIGDSKITTQWNGVIYDNEAWRLPMELPMHQWDWRHDRPADAELTAQALKESLQPVLPGEPGKFGFWTWRTLVRNGKASVIYPPSFDLQETPNAAKYRFTVTSANKEGKPAKYEFTADKPWRPLAPLWKELAPGAYQLTVTALDVQGNEIPATMHLGILEKATAKPAAVETKSISFVKRPAFSGPYTQGATDWLDAALGASRCHAEALGLAERRGHSISESGNEWAQSGDHGFGMCIAAQIWANLAARSLTNDAAERLFAEEMLAYNAETLETHQRIAKLPGSIYDYQANTPMAHWPGEAILDAYLQTGDPRWKEIALKLGAALVKLQNDNGSFFSTYGWPKEMVGPHGFYSWKEGNKEYSSVELLYLFGRLRRDLKTDSFVDAEKKAYDWTLNVAVRDRSFPLNLAHSMSQGYPIWSHGVAALYLSRYLLECAPPERRDVKLAEELARWAEDHGINWARAEGKQTGALTPRVEQIDRYNNAPVATNMLAAVVFAELAQATGNPLWAAKADALASAVLQGRDPKHGRLVTSLAPTTEEWMTRQFHDASFRHGSFGSDWAIPLLREYAVLKSQASK
ncbi:MAG: hypothetical protein WCL32_10505 [Planctomycetota bacterium]